MHPLLNLAKRFGRDERGVFAILFGVMAIVLVALGGSVVDYVSLEQSRNRAQIALDAAALALQPEIFKAGVTPEQIRQKAERLVREQLAGQFGVTAAVPNVRVNIPDGRLFLQGQIDVPTSFVALVGVRDLKAVITAEASRKKLALEIAMVLDNSGSMSYTGAGANGTRQRIQFLKDAANCATNILFFDKVVDSTSNPDTCVPAAGAVQVDDVSVSVVPFTMYVNIGASNSTATWIDRTGGSVIANDNFDNDDNDATPFTAPVNRLALYDAITNDDWRGCVEARPHIATSGATGFLDTDDTAPNTTQPNTLFVPLFAPDLPETLTTLSSSNSYNNYTPDHPAACKVTGTCDWTEVKTQCNGSGACSGTTTNTYVLTGRDKGSLSCNCPGATTLVSTTTTGTGNNRTITTKRSCSYQYDAQNLSNRELQERMCKYTGAISFNNNQKGPNADCPIQPLLPLNTNPTTVRNSISAMVASGGTNIHEGTAWGYRALSPTVPFTQGSPYSQSTSKVLIMMTDGENTAYQTGNMNGSYYYSAYGYPYNSKNTDANSSSSGNVDRLTSISATNAQIVQEMNTRTLQTCTNAKAAGITVYTIGLATSQSVQSTQAVVENMLRQCASSTDRAYFPQTPGELKATFQRIANELSALRLVQ